MSEVRPAKGGVQGAGIANNPQHKFSLKLP